MHDMDDDILSSEYDVEEFDDFEFGDDADDDLFGLGTGNPSNYTATTCQKVAPETLRRIRRDFRIVREAGFLISRICGFSEITENNIVSISVRVDHLCLSEETRDAWNLSDNDYIVLLIRYHLQYTTFDETLHRAAGSSNIDFRLRKCAKYKPTAQQAIKAFSKPSLKRHGPSTLSSQPVDLTSAENTNFALLGVGESIDTFMNTDFVPMLKLRRSRCATWDIAKRELISLSRSAHGQQDETSTTQVQVCTVDVENTDQTKLPGFIAKEHLHDTGEISLPLVAAQFALRYYIRCTDYCMVCHEQVDGNFEALKPYVCGNSLCLFQYMSMGFGPSIDLEVLNQPNVVDLLVSFCYAGLQNMGHAGVHGLRDYPTGLNLAVPRIVPHYYVDTEKRSEREIVLDGAKLLDPIPGTFDWVGSSFNLDVATDIIKVGEKAWMTVVVPIADTMMKNIVHHGQVRSIAGTKVTLYIVARHTLPVSASTDVSMSSDLHDPTATAYLVPYNQNLDDIRDNSIKAFPLTLLLAATPSVRSMREYLQASPNRVLDQWQQLIPSASKFLRWIIASNRSYVVQVDELAQGGAAEDEASLSRPNERISGVDNWIQFRFAQGSPEKEVNFQEELKKLNKPQKTILGWHGSSLGNWHSIIREGLDFKFMTNGRAYGDGVYFGRDFDTSLGYASNRNLSSGTVSLSTTWPNSGLKVENAVSLSEIVNRPEEFANLGRTEWCYVVQHIHWIQCRYLFVKPERSLIVASESVATPQRDEFVQDSRYVATGPRGSKLCIPKIAIPSCQSNTTRQSSTLLKKNADGHSEKDDVEDDEDIDFLLSDEDNGPTTVSAQMQFETCSGQTVPWNWLQTDKTDFRPGTLDLSSLPRLAPPEYATRQGQKTIGTEITKLQKVQNKTPVHELGWHIDFDNITNMFHWIAELHSFDPKLQLATDMKQAGVSSIVLEIRFGRDFPLSPPFLRVVRPRFMPFANGGGGHVTAGGALCMELLTNSGWSPANSLESVLLQVRVALCSVDPRPARLQSTHGFGADYGIHEAYEAYTRAAMTHGWQVPKDLMEATTAMMPSNPEE